jgi:hypothetical protein
MFAVLDFFPDFCIIFFACALAAGAGSATALFRKRDAARLLRVEQKLDLILKKANLEFVPPHELPEDALEALRAGQDDQAAELYRKARGIDLEQAKQYIAAVKKSGDY